MSEPDQAALVVTAAREWIGTPYRHQASLKGVGADCLGLVRGVWRQVVGPEPERIPPYSVDWAEAQDADRLLEAARRNLIDVPLTALGPGAVVLFRWRRGRPGKHLGILSRPDRFIHAYEHAGVTETWLSDWWCERMVCGFRFPECEKRLEV